MRHESTTPYGATRRLFNAVRAAAVGLATLAMVTMPAAAATPARVVALGDSLTAGFGLPEEDGFTGQLERALRAAGYDAEVVNAGVSGDTTAGGLARLDWALADDPTLVIVELGANDALRGLDPAQARVNLDRILKRVTERKIPVLLAGMQAPRNLGPEYVERFDAIYPELAKKYGVPLYPFFLDGVVMDPGLTLGDGLHPNAKGVGIMVKGILPYVTKMLDTQG